MSQSSSTPSQITSGPGTITLSHCNMQVAGLHTVVPTPHDESQFAPPVPSSSTPLQLSSTQLHTSGCGVTSSRHGPNVLVGPHTAGQVLVPPWHGPMPGLPGEMQVCEKPSHVPSQSLSLPSQTSGNGPVAVQLTQSPATQLSVP